MTQTFQTQINDRRFRQAMKQAPSQVGQEVSRGTGRAALETANRMKRDAPKGGTSTLTNSIAARRIDEFSQRVAPSVRYAAFVESGRQPGSYPNFQSLADWARTVLGISDADELRDVTWAIARKIKQQGIDPQPFVQPLFESGYPAARLGYWVNRGVDRGLKRAGL